MLEVKAVMRGEVLCLQRPRVTAADWPGCQAQLAPCDPAEGKRSGNGEVEQQGKSGSFLVTDPNKAVTESIPVRIRVDYENNVIDRLCNFTEMRQVH